MQVLKQLQIPYSFAKRHGVLLRYEGDQAFIVRRESTPLLALQEARRFLGDGRFRVCKHQRIFIGDINQHFTYFNDVLMKVNG
jgi:general secretion pathway protein E